MGATASSMEDIEDNEFTEYMNKLDKQVKQGETKTVETEVEDHKGDDTQHEDEAVRWDAVVYDILMCWPLPIVRVNLLHDQRIAIVCHAGTSVPGQTGLNVAEKYVPNTVCEHVKENLRVLALPPPSTYFLTREDLQTQDQRNSPHWLLDALWTDAESSPVTPESWYRYLEGSVGYIFAIMRRLRMVADRKDVLNRSMNLHGLRTMFENCIRQMGKWSGPQLVSVIRFVAMFARLVQLCLDLAVIPFSKTVVVCLPKNVAQLVCSFLTMQHFVDVASIIRDTLVDDPNIVATDAAFEALIRKAMADNSRLATIPRENLFSRVDAHS